MLSANNKFSFLIDLTYDQLQAGQSVEREMLEERCQREKDELVRYQRQQMHILEGNFCMKRKEMGKNHKKERSEWSDLQEENVSSTNCFASARPNKRTKLFDETSDTLPRLDWSIYESADDLSIQILDQSNDKDESIIILSDSDSESIQSIIHDAFDLSNKNGDSEPIANSTEIDASDDLF